MYFIRTNYTLGERTNETGCSTHDDDYKYPRTSPQFCSKYTKQKLMAVKEQSSAQEELSHFHKTRLYPLTYNYRNFTPVTLWPSVHCFTVKSSSFLTHSGKFKETCNLNLSFSLLTHLLQLSP